MKEHDRGGLLVAEKLTYEQRMRDFADALREALAMAGMSQQALADAIGYTQSAIGNFLAARNMPQEPDVVFAMERALGITPGGLSRHLGYLPPEAFQTVASFEAALEADTALNADEKLMLKAAYEAARAKKARRRRSPGA